MIFSLAPMEGVTGHVFRCVHAECFGALDRYYTPFVAPSQVGKGFVGRAKKELDPAANEGLDVVPQLLTRDADRFVWAAGLLQRMGYREVNLNAGCPSGTVVSKGKGAGFLREPRELEAFLRDVCERSPLPVSVKTRIGVEKDDEYGEVLAAYCRCHLAELIVHPRLRVDAYRGTPREPYGRTLEEAPFAVAYNMAYLSGRFSTRKLVFFACGYLVVGEALCFCRAFLCGVAAEQNPAGCGFGHPLSPHDERRSDLCPS